jgi:hypothetical protein
MAKQVKNTDGITRPFYDRQPQDRKHFASIPRFNEYPPPNDDLFGECGKLNDLWRPHVNGVLTVLLDEDLWAGEQWQKERAVELMLYLMQWLFECEDDMQLRQSATDPCVLEQLVNGQWTIAFDYGKCLKANTPAIPTDIIPENVAPIVEASQTAFDDIFANGLASEYPLAVNSPSDPLNSPKNAILCAVTRDYLTKLADFIQAMAQSQAKANEPNLGQFLVDWGTTIGTGVTLVGTIVNPAFGAGLAWLNNVARVGAGASFLYSSTRTVNTTGQFVADLRSAYFDNGVNPVVIDDDTRNQLICVLYEGLKDNPLTQGNFNLALENLPEANSIEQALKNIVLWLFLTNVSYGEFVMVYNQMMVAQQTGAEFNDNDCGCGEPPIECGISYDWLLQDSPPSDVTFYESVPANAVPVVIPYVPAIPIQPASPFVTNQFVSVYQVYELPCNLPITARWWRANTNSASAVIETFDGAEWTVRDTGAISVGTVSAFKDTLYWANPTNITYQGCRVRVTSSAPRIDTFIIG